MDINKYFFLVKNRIKFLTKHYPYTSFEINIFCICYVAITLIDPFVSDLLDEVLATKYILLNDGSFDKLLRDYYKNSDIYSDSYYLPDFDKNKVSKNDFIVIRYSEKRTIYDLIDGYLHEIKHAMNTIVNSYSKGIFFLGISYMKNGMKKRIILEEVFNSYITKVYLDKIMEISNQNIMDVHVKEILNKFKLPRNYEYAYSEVTNFFIQIFENTEFFWLFYNAALYKDFDSLNKRMLEVYGIDIDHVNSILVN